MSESTLHRRIADRVHALRTEQGLSLEALASRSGVSRSMISLIERGESSPTAVVLERLAAGLGVMLASLFDQAPTPQADPLARRAAQVQWTDPESGYRRRNLSPPAFASPLQLVEVEFPPGARVAYDTAERQARVHQQLWVMAGAMHVILGEERHALSEGDCLAMVLDRPIVFHNPHEQPARYLVAIVTETVAAAAARSTRHA